jgi:hypothetical protein
VPVLPNEEFANEIVYEMHILAAPHQHLTKAHLLALFFGDGRISWFEAWEIVLHNNLKKVLPYIFGAIIKLKLKTRTVIIL